MYKVGYSRVDISPTEPVPLMGYGNPIRRISGPVLDPLYATCVAIGDEEGNTILMIGVDSTVPNYTGYIREEVSKATGVPEERIVINVTHTHSAPDLDAKHPGVDAYKPIYKEGCVKAAVEAFKDMQPANLSYGSIETEGLNFVRHYRMDDGSFGGDNFGDWENHYAVANATEVDKTMHLLKFNREKLPLMKYLYPEWPKRPNPFSKRQMLLFSPQTSMGRSLPFSSASFPGMIWTYLDGCI